MREKSFGTFSENYRHYEKLKFDKYLFRFRPFGSKRLYPTNDSVHSHEFRIYTHKAMESRDVTLDHARAKQFVFAAIILSQFCQVTFFIRYSKYHF